MPLFYPELAADPIDWDPLNGGVAVDATGTLYIADAYNARLRKVDPSGTISTVARVGSGGVGLDSMGNVLVSTGDSLVKVTLDGVVSSVVGGNCGHPGSAGLCGTGLLAVDANDNVYVTDGYCDVVKVDRFGNVSRVAGDSRPNAAAGIDWSCGYYGDGGPATIAGLNYPGGVAVDRGGNLYIADTYNNCIRKVDTAGTITTFAGICKADGSSRGYSGDGGFATNAQLYTPYGLAVDASGNLYVADTGNNRIRLVTADGRISTVAGNGALGPAGTRVATITVFQAGGHAPLLWFNIFGAQPTGTVTFVDGSTVVGTVQLTYPGSKSVGAAVPTYGTSSEAMLADASANHSPGIHTITANYSGDTYNLPSTGAAQVTVQNATSSASAVAAATDGSDGGHGGAGAITWLELLALLAAWGWGLRRTRTESVNMTEFDGSAR